MDKSNNNAIVHSFTDRKNAGQARIELDSARRCQSMSSFAWDLTVQQVLRLAGLPISDALLAEDLVPSTGSLANQLGHETLQSLVSKSEAEDGMGQDWSDFRERLTAVVYKQKYQITENEYREINNQVEDATQILGRAPMDGSEFHGAKQKALVEKIANVERESQFRISDLTDKNSALMRDMGRKQQELETSRQETQRLSQEAAQKITDMRRETAASMERTERMAEERVSREVERMTQEKLQALAQQREEISGAVREAESKRLVVEDELRTLQRKIDAGEYVPASVLENLNARLDASGLVEVELRNQLLSFNEQLTTEQHTTHALRQEIEALRFAASDDKQQIQTLEKRLSDVIEDRLGSTEFAVLQERLQMSRSENAQLTATIGQLQHENAKLERGISQFRGAHQTLKLEGRQYCNNLKEQLTQANQNNQNLVRQVSQTKLILGIVLASGVISSVALGLSLTGIL